MKRMLGIGQRCCRPNLRRLSQLSSEQPQSTIIDQDIVVPKRIPRGPTDILRALATTIHTDPTAPNYKYIDDPFLIPAANLDKRTYALSRESGKNAARYFLEKFPHFFKNNPADPNVELFNAPRPAFQAGQENTQQDLLRCIDELNVAEALIVYENLQSQGAEITEETLLKLLQLLSFFNATQPPNPDLVEEKFFGRFHAPTRNNWKTGEIVEQIFDRIDNKNAEAYSALIQGMLKYYDADRGYRLYEEMRSKHLVPSVHVYNYLICCVPRVREGFPDRAELLLQILRNMKEDGVQPNLITFNNALFICPRLGSSDGKRYCSRILAEMKSLKIEPSLATYHFVLTTMYKPRGGPPQVIHEVLEKTLNRHWEIRDTRDVSFLMTAMEIVHEYVLDKNLAYKLVELAEQNPHMLSNGYNQAVFYQHLFTLLCKTEDIDKFMSVYHQLTPNIYAPEMSVMSAILDAIELHRAYRYLPQLWSDMILTRHSENEKILKQMLALTAAVERGISKESQALQQHCVVIAHDILTRVIRVNEQRRERFRMPLQLDAEAISNMMQCFLTDDNMEYAAEALKYLVANQNSLPGVPAASVLTLFAKKACETKAENMAMTCAKYCLGIGHEEIVDFIKEEAVKQKFSDDFLQQLEV